MVAPASAPPTYDLTQILTDRHTGPKQMVEFGENFFTSLGLSKLPDTFWQRSLLARPRTAMSSAMQAPGTSTMTRTCGSKSAFMPPPTTSRPCTTSSATTITSSPTATNHFFSGAAPTTAFTRRSATDRAVDHTGIFKEDRLDRAAPSRLRRHSVAAALRARQDCLSALWTADRQMALASFLGPGEARRLQQGLVGAARASIKASLRRSIAAKPISTPARSITFRTTLPTRAISSRASTSSSSIARCASRRAIPDRLIAARFTNRKKPGPSSVPCFSLEFQNRGRRRCAP